MSKKNVNENTNAPTSFSSRGKNPLVEMLNPWPPILVRLLQRPWRSNRELARTTRLTRRQLDDYSHSYSWATMPVALAGEFMNICGFNPRHVKRHREFVRRGNWSHLKSQHARALLVQLVRYAGYDQQIVSDRETMMCVACDRYAAGELSLGAAAKLSMSTRAAFERELGRRKIVRNADLPSAAEMRLLRGGGR